MGLLSTLIALAGCNDDAATVGSGTSGMSDAPETDGADSSGVADDSTGEQPESFIPGPGGMRKLTSREYTESIALMLGEEAADAAAAPLDVGQQGFDAVGAALLPLPTDSIELYERSATAVANAVIGDLGPLQTLVPCVDEDAETSCYGEVATTLGRFAFRRSLDPVEVDALAALGAEARDWDEDGAFVTGLRYQLTALLQAPSFLYIQEVGEPDPEGDFRRLTSTELATRMSFFLTGHTPSLELLDAAEAGELETPEQIHATAAALVASPEARPALNNFFSEALRLRNLASAPKNADIFPEFSPELGDAMEQETLLLLTEIIWNEDADFRSFFNADHTYVNDELAALYGMDPPGQGDLFTATQWPPGQNRAGYTSQASFLTWQSGPRRNSPTKRGLYIQERILCNELEPPDPNAELDLPDSEDLTLKELLELHLDKDSCRGCHGQTDPLGFAFESYTAVGAYRTTDNGKPVETDGAVAGIGAWANAKELGDILASHPRTATCLIENLMRGRIGRAPLEDEEPAIADLEHAFEASGYSVQTLLVEMAAHPLFRLVDEPK